MIWLFTMMPPPTPVPSVRQMAWVCPLAAPSFHSAIAMALASFSMVVGRLVRDCSSCLSGMFVHPGTLVRL